MKVIAISDLHGYLPQVEPFDLLLICGDICPVWEKHERQVQGEWLSTAFVNWVNSLKYKTPESKVVLIAGNHDFIFEGITKERLNLLLKNVSDHRLVYLDNEEYIFNFEGKDYRIFGCPYCKVFGNWAFMRENLEKYYDEIPEGIDFLITHDAADINNLGYIHEGWQIGKNAGNQTLAEYVKEKKPKYYFCGHIHSGNHKFEEVDGTMMANVSSVDEKYDLTQAPLIFEV